LKIKPWIPYDQQMAKFGGHYWSVPRLVQLAKDLPVMDVPLDHLRISYTYDEMRLKDLVMHIQAVNDADLEFPIILDDEGDILDGRHRVMKAILLGHETIKAVRFEETPAPCKIDQC